MKRNIKKALCKALVSTMIATSFFSLAQVYAATDTATNLAQRYVIEKATEMGQEMRVLFKNEDKTDTFDNPIVNVNNRVYIPIRDLSQLLSAQISWDNEAKVATIVKNDKVIEVPIGSEEIVVNGNPVHIDSQNSKAFLYHSRTYLPVRIICDYCGFPVDYQEVDGIKYVLIDSQVPNPSLHTYDSEIEVPEQYKDTTFLEIYNSLRRTSGLTEEQAKIVMGTIKSFAPLSNENHQYDKYIGECMRSQECIDIHSVSAGDTAPGEWLYQPHNSIKGQYWNGNNWECNEALYFGY